MIGAGLLFSVSTSGNAWDSLAGLQITSSPISSPTSLIEGSNLAWILPKTPGTCVLNPLLFVARGGGLVTSRGVVMTSRGVVITSCGVRRFQILCPTFLFPSLTP